MDTKSVAQEFGEASDALLAACQKLERFGVADPPIEQLYQALDQVTAEVQRLQPPPAERRWSSEDLRVPGCRAALRAD